MDNRNILGIGSILADFNQEATSKIYKFNRFVQERIDNQEKEATDDSQADEYEFQEPICDYDAMYQDLCLILDNIKKKWGTDDIDSNLLNTSYHRDLMYLYNRISLDMSYLNEFQADNHEQLEKLLELKYEIRNLF